VTDFLVTCKLSQYGIIWIYHCAKQQLDALYDVFLIFNLFCIIWQVWTAVEVCTWHSVSRSFSVVINHTQLWASEEKWFHSSMVKSSNLGFCLLLSKVSSWSSAMVGRWQEDEDLPRSLLELLWMPSSPFSALVELLISAASTLDWVRSTTPPDLIQISLLSLRSGLTLSLFSSSLLCCPLSSRIAQPCILIDQETMHNWLLSSSCFFFTLNISLVLIWYLVSDWP